MRQREIKNLKTLQSAKKLAVEHGFMMILSEEIDAREYKYTDTQTGELITGVQTRQFHVFEDVKQLFFHCEDKKWENLHFHEVIPENNSRLSFDFDISFEHCSNLPASFFDDIESIISNCVFSNFRDLYLLQSRNTKLHPDALEFNWLESKNNKKFSFHLIVSNIILSDWVKISKFIYHKIYEEIRKSDKFTWIKPEHLIDIAWPKRNTSLRMPFNSKISGNPIFPKHTDEKTSKFHIFKRYLVGNYSMNDPDYNDVLVNLNECIDYSEFDGRNIVAKKPFELSDHLYKFAISQFKKYDTDNTFSISSPDDNLIRLTRNKKSLCPCCDREHDGDNAYLLVKKNRDIRFYCYRNTDNKYIQIYKHNNICDDFWHLYEGYTISMFLDNIRYKVGDDLVIKTIYNPSEFTPSDDHSYKFISKDAFVYQLSKLCRYIENTNQIIMKISDSHYGFNYQTLKFSEFCSLFVQKFKFAHIKHSNDTVTNNTFDINSLSYKNIKIQNFITEYATILNISQIYYKDSLSPKEKLQPKPILFPRYGYLKYISDYEQHPQFQQIKTMFWQQIRRLTGSTLSLKTDVDINKLYEFDTLFSDPNYILHGELDSANYVLKCLAWMIQKPYSKWKRGLVFHSKFKQLAGKSLLFKQIFASLLIRNYHATADINKERKDLFDSKLINSHLVLFEEQFFKLSELSYFKEFITGDELNIRKMREERTSQYSYHNVILNTNSIGDVAKVVHDDTERFICFSMHPSFSSFQHVSKHFTSLLATTFGVNAISSSNSYIDSDYASYLLFSWLKSIDLSDFFPNSTFSNSLTNRIKNKDDFIDLDGFSTVYIERGNRISDPIESFITELLDSVDSDLYSSCCKRGSSELYLPNLLKSFRIWAKTYSYTIPSDTAIRSSIKNYFISLGYTSSGSKSSELRFSI